jgi:hypothetical protein
MPCKHQRWENVYLLLNDFGTRWGEWPGSRPPAALYTRERTTSIHRIGDWVGLRPGLDIATRGKNPLPLPGSENRLSSLQTGTILTELPTSETKWVYHESDCDAAVWQHTSAWRHQFYVQYEMFTVEIPPENYMNWLRHTAECKYLLGGGGVFSLICHKISSSDLALLFC